MARPNDRRLRSTPSRRDEEQDMEMWDSFAALIAPWPAVAAHDLGRYLLAAGIVTLLLTCATVRFRALRSVRDRQPADGQRWREFRHSVGAVAVFATVGLVVHHGAVHGVLHVYTKAASFGWAYWLLSLVLIVVAHDAYFYWTHRWMHGRVLFRRMHRVHHRSVAPTQWAAYSFSFGEAFVHAVFLPLYLLVVPTHVGVIVVWTLHQVLRNAFGHCGVEPEPVRWLEGWWGRWLTTTLHHDLHHAGGRHNFGLYFTWWDRLCGTEHPEYRERLRTLIERMRREPGRVLVTEESRS
jgi:Delta7-sterol 5-desaturase